MTQRVYGEKYSKDLNTTQIAALVRDEVKAAVKAGQLPKAKYGIRTHYYAGGSSIRIRISELPGQVFEPEYLTRGDAYLSGPSVQGEDGWQRPSRYTPWVTKAVAKVSAMLAAYNYDGSDIQTDLYDVKFHADVAVRTTEAEEQAAREALATAKDYEGEASMMKAEESEPAGVVSIGAGRGNVIRLLPAAAESDQIRFMRESGAI